MPALVAAPPQRLAGRSDAGSTLVRSASGSPQGCIAVVNRVRSSARLPGSVRGQGPMGLWADLRGQGPIDNVVQHRAGPCQFLSATERQVAPPRLQIPFERR